MKTIITVLVLLSLCASADAGIIQGRRDVSSPPSSADCYEFFDTSDTGDVDGNTEFDSEVDDSSKVSIVSGELVLDVGTPSTAMYVIESTCVSDSDTELTIKGKIKFDDVTGVDDGIGYIVPVVIYDDADAQVQMALVLSLIHI